MFDVNSSEEWENGRSDAKITDIFFVLGTTYLDHAGATLYSEKQMRNICRDLETSIYANPHSLHSSSKSTEDTVDVIRYKILQHFNTTNEEFSVVFTSGTTNALKIIAECFDYGKTSGTLAHLEDNHTSVLGMRNFAKNSVEVKVEKAFEIMSKHVDVPCTENKTTNNIFVYPAESNFSGTKYPLEWIGRVRNGVLNELVDTKSRNWYVVLDAPGYVATSNLDLSKYMPDFVTVSFYKMFGYPTGLGALLVRKTSEKLLKKIYFGGGAVSMVLSSQNVMVPRNTFHERFEDGTLPFLSIVSVKHGFDTIKRVGLNFDTISKHTFSLAQYVYRHFLTLHHSNGNPAVLLYHDTTFEDPIFQGGKINFTLLRENGDHIGYSEVLQMANLHGIHLRTGCHCNPGACQRFLKLKPCDVLKNFNMGHVCGDQNDLIDGHPTGTVRISFGYMSTKEDCDALLKMIDSCFVSQPIMRRMPPNWNHLQKRFHGLFHNNKQLVTQENTKPTYKATEIMKHISNQPKNVRGTLEQVFVYPIKSCGAFQVSESWILTPKGLKYDREWMIVNSMGVCLAQKQNRKLCLIKPVIDLKRKTLELHCKGQPNIEVDLEHSSNMKEAYLCQSKVCGNRVTGWDCGDEISDWLSETLDMPGLRLLRQYEPENEGGVLSFVLMNFLF
ncbi:hypothetical protein JTB14_012991 [Gonioctena quinquepunctata]|nr:hypothetical protein JTB14_012991 [Gonioctena quinquepunctata]